MARQMSPECEQEFEELRAFVDFCTTNIFGLSPDNPAHVSHTLQGIVEKFGKSKALNGLRQAANDAIEATGGFSPERVAQLDSALQEKGILTLSEMRRRHSSTYKRILKRGHIKTETEYHLINGIVVDNTALLMPPERTSLQNMLIAYENGG